MDPADLPTIPSKDTSRFECPFDHRLHIISHLRSLHRKTETEDATRRTKRLRIGLTILGILLGLGIVATAIAVPVSLLTGHKTTARTTTTTEGKRLTLSDNILSKYLRIAPTVMLYDSADNCLIE